MLTPWAADLRAVMPRIALHFEVDYSNQIMRDIAAGAADLGVVYAPSFLPDLVVEKLGEEEYVMISTSARRLSEVNPEHYIRVGYTPAFEKRRDELLPALARLPLSAGCEDLAVELLKTLGGTAYLPRFVAGRIGLGPRWLRTPRPSSSRSSRLFISAGSTCRISVCP